MLKGENCRSISTVIFAGGFDLGDKLIRSCLSSFLHICALGNSVCPIRKPSTKITPSDKANDGLVSFGVSTGATNKAGDWQSGTVKLNVEAPASY